MNERNRRNRLDDIRRVAEAVREAPVEAPDFTAAILDRVDVERPFLAPSVRRRLPWIRIGLGVCVAATTLSIAMTYRYAPQTMRAVAQQPAPMSDVVQCVECAAAARLAPANFGAPRGGMLSVRESDATQFLAAMVTVASISENDGRRVSDATNGSVPMGRLATPSQVVSINTPAAPAAPTATRMSVNPMLLASRFETAVIPSEPFGGMFAAESPRVRIVPAFLEHDLDGIILAR